MTPYMTRLLLLTTLIACDDPGRSGGTCASAEACHDATVTEVGPTDVSLTEVSPTEVDASEVSPTEVDAREVDAAPDTNVCVPACADRVCGSDGCGATCGACSGDDRCEEGRCIDPCEPYDCGIAPETGKDCGNCGGATVICQHNHCTDPCEAGHCDQCGAADLAAIAASDPEPQMATCAAGCTTAPHQPRCIGECVAANTTLSSACSDCYGRFGACLLNQCLAPCFEADSEACRSCRARHCDPAFNLCVGG